MQELKRITFQNVMRTVSTYSAYDLELKKKKKKLSIVFVFISLYNLFSRILLCNRIANDQRGM